MAYSLLWSVDHQRRAKIQRRAGIQRRAEMERRGDRGVSADRIALRGLTVRGFHGVFDFERRDGQDFVVDVELELDTRVAARSDDLSDTVHYGELASGLAGVVAGEPVNLLETLAERLVAVCLTDARVEAATVTVHKPQAPIPLQFADVAVTIRRARE